jgi:hypothetical protein
MSAISQIDMESAKQPKNNCSLVDWYYKAYLLIEQTNQQYWSCYRGLLDNFCVIKRTTLLDHQVGNACPFDSIWVFYFLSIMVLFNYFTSSQLRGSLTRLI